MHFVKGGDSIGLAIAEPFPTATTTPFRSFAGVSPACFGSCVGEPPQSQRAALCFENVTLGAQMRTATLIPFVGYSVATTIVLIQTSTVGHWLHVQPLHPDDWALVVLFTLIAGAILLRSVRWRVSSPDTCMRSGIAGAIRSALNLTGSHTSGPQINILKLRSCPRFGPPDGAAGEQAATRVCRAPARPG
jgi:hypothetical protein